MRKELERLQKIGVEGMILDLRNNGGGALEDARIMSGLFIEEGPIVQIRNHNALHARETLQCESTDGGRTWTKPASIGVWGLPSHLLNLHDGRVVMTYGYRRAPYGNQARLSEDGRRWSEPLTISDDGASGDLGYPSTAQLSDGTMVSIWYELLRNSSKAVLRQARWKLEE